MRPSVGRIVHYVSRGSADGRFPSTCRAAVITEVGAWVDVEVRQGAGDEPSDGDDRIVRQVYRADACALSALNPTGLFFDPAVPHDELPPADRIVAGERTSHLAGTWHWPERVEG